MGREGREIFREEVRDALNTPSTGLSPQRAMEVARAVLPRNTIATCDAGASRLLVVQKWESYGPREFLTSNGLGSMGYAVPGALAARLAFPDRPVVAFTGDGGFLMTVAELQTRARKAADHRDGVRRPRNRTHSRQAGDQGIPLYGVELGGVDWEKLAKAFGADGTWWKPRRLWQGAARGREVRATTVIAVRIDASGYVAQFNALREL